MKSENLRKISSVDKIRPFKICKTTVKVQIFFKYLNLEQRKLKEKVLKLSFQFPSYNILQIKNGIILLLLLKLCLCHISANHRKCLHEYVNYYRIQCDQFQKAVLCILRTNFTPTDLMLRTLTSLTVHISGISSWPRSL